MCGARSCAGGGVEMLPEEVVQAANHVGGNGS
jgi:hypothetical protein